MQVNFLGFDLYALGYVQAIPAIQELRTYQRDKLYVNTIDIQCHNFDDFFTLDKASSPLNGALWRYAGLTIVDNDGITIWDGLVTNIRLVHGSTKSATIQTKDKLYQQKNQLVSYTSSAWETPATAAYNICAALGYTDIDNKSFTDSIARLTAAGCYVKCQIAKEDNLMFLSALEKLAVYAAADCYVHANKIYFQHVSGDETNSGVVITITEDNIEGDVEVDRNDDQLINEYSISYFGDSSVPATDANSNNIAVASRTRFDTHEFNDMKGGDQGTTGAGKNQITFYNKASATYIGESYIKRCHMDLTSNPRPRLSVRMDINYELRNYIDLTSLVRIKLTDEDWDTVDSDAGKVFEIFEISRDEVGRRLTIQAYER